MNNFTECTNCDVRGLESCSDANTCICILGYNGNSPGCSECSLGYYAATDTSDILDCQGK